MVEKQSEHKVWAVLGGLFRLAVNIVIIYLMIKLFLFAYGFAYQVFANDAYQPEDETTITFTIHKGASALNVAESLKEDGVIENQYTFVLRYRFSKYNGKIQAGKYTVSPSMKTDDILAVLSGEEPSEEGE